jgi:hypothetical protein
MGRCFHIRKMMLTMCFASCSLVLSSLLSLSSYLRRRLFRAGFYEHAQSWLDPELCTTWAVRARFSSPLVLALLCDPGLAFRTMVIHRDILHLISFCHPFPALADATDFCDPSICLSAVCFLFATFFFLLSIIHVGFGDS